MKKFIYLLIALIFFSYLLSPAYIYNKYKKRIYVDAESSGKSTVAIVFGAGLRRDGTPSDVLRDRLRIAEDLYSLRKVKKIIVSGDNRVEDYNEPDSMAEYLINDLGVEADDVVKDFAGRRTYDTCKRANEIWSVDDAILVTQGYHLPRAIFTCTKLGVNSTGISATQQDYLGEARFKTREILAIYKAVLDVYLLSPEYIGGEQEELVGN